MKDNLSTRICGGKYKGRKLLLPSLSSTRSTKSIVKESYFNTIQFDIVDKIFVEVFAGSGSVGLEALSRGAEKVYFIERDKDAYEILMQNIKSIDVSSCKAYNADSFEKFHEIIEEIKRESYFYFDPPFEIRDGMRDIYKNTYELIKSIPKDICQMVTIEHMSNLSLPDKIGDYTLIKRKKFGKTSLSYYME